MGLQADDYILREQVLEDGPFAAYLFSPLDPQAAHTKVLEARAAGRAPWWADEHTRVSYFRPLSSLSLWLDFAHGARPWWMHLENGAIYAALVWLAVALYRQLGLSGAGLGWAAVFFGLDGALAASAGWISARNTLLAACFGLACLLFHDRARRAGRPILLTLSCLCFALSLLSAEFGLCVLGYLGAHALSVDRAPRMRRAIALAPYGALTALYLVHYVTAGYGSIGGGGVHRDVFGSPAAAALAWVESIPVWLASAATMPFAGFQLLRPDLRLPILAFSLVVLAVILPLLGSRSIEQPHGRMFAIGAVLSLVPLAAVVPQERLRFFVAFGVYGVLGPWVVSHFDAPERVHRRVARLVWRMHGVWLPLFFVPLLFSIVPIAGGAARALDEALPRAAMPITILLNPPTSFVPWYQPAMRASRGEIGPPVFALYAGNQSLDIQRVDDRSLELHVARSWFSAPFERNRDDSRHWFRAGDRIPLARLTVEVREVDAAGAPTRARFAFDRSLDDPSLSFRYWKGSKLALWTPPPAGGRVKL
jgi:hypothetical protein